MESSPPAPPDPSSVSPHLKLVLVNDVAFGSRPASELAAATAASNLTEYMFRWVSVGKGRVLGKRESGENLQEGIYTYILCTKYIHGVPASELAMANAKSNDKDSKSYSIENWR